MPHRHIGTALQVGDAADVGAQNGFGLERIEVAQLAVTQGVTDVGVEHAVGACRTAAQV